MNNSPSKRPLNPRKTPSQPRSAHTVAAILEGAAHILEDLGLAGYTTNAIAARAGVSIGSLYQYFPGKDAVTLALIDREMAEVVHEATQALTLDDTNAALRQLIDVAVRHQLRRPVLAAVLDFEQNRLSALKQTSNNVIAMQAALVAYVGRVAGPGTLAPSHIASDLMAMISAMTDAAGRRDAADPAQLADRIEGAVRGYLLTL